MGEVRGAEYIICAENYNQLNIYINKHFNMLINYRMVLSFDVINKTHNNNKKY